MMSQKLMTVLSAVAGHIFLTLSQTFFTHVLKCFMLNQATANSNFLSLFSQDQISNLWSPSEETITIQETTEAVDVRE